MGEYQYFKYLLTECSDGRRYIDFIYQGQEDKGRDVDCSVVIRIRQPLFAATIDYYKQQNGGKIYIVSAERKVIASTEEEDELPYAVNFDGAENYMTKQKDDIVFTSYSKTSGWTIVSVVPNDIYRQKIQIIRRFAFLNVICCLLFGVLMVIFSRSCSAFWRDNFFRLRQSAEQRVLNLHLAPASDFLPALRC